MLRLIDGQYNLTFNMQNMMEDFYLPVRGGDASTRIETTQGLDYDGTNRCRVPYKLNCLQH